MPVIKLIKTEIDRKIDENSPLKSRLFLWDSEIKGFGLQVTPAGVASFIFQYRSGKGRAGVTQKVTIGRYPAMTVTQARDMAKRLAGTVAHGGDPAAAIREDKAKLSLAAVAEKFLKEHVAVKLKAKTAYDYELLLKGICSELGTRKLADLTSRTIAQFHLRMQDRPYLANRRLAVLSSLFSWAAKNGFVASGVNPCRNIDHYREAKKTDFLQPEDLRLILSTIDEMLALGEQRRQTKTRRKKGESAEIDTLTLQAATALKALLLTGARRNEILSLQWEYIDAERGTAYLPDSKTGFKVLQLPEAVLELLVQMPRISPYVFPSSKADSKYPFMTEIQPRWKAVLKKAGLSDSWRLHDLRHAFASAAVSAGEALPIVGAVLGHKDARTTSRYAHVAPRPAQRVAEGTAALILQRTKEN